MCLPLNNLVRGERADDRRSALTLIELMVASAIMAMVVAALAVLANAVQVGAEHGDTHGEAIQHGRVALERITRLANEATTSPLFPGLLVVTTTVGTDPYPDALVIWHPTGEPVDPAGLPRWNELVIFCPHPDRPNELIELTAPDNATTVPEPDGLADWREAIETLKTSETSHRVVLTDLVRAASTDDSGMASSRRACVRFKVRLRPSDDDLEDYKDDEVEWNELPWVQNLYGPKTGLRHVWLRIELQLTPRRRTSPDDLGTQTAIPLFDSAAVYYTIHDEDLNGSG